MRELDKWIAEKIMGECIHEWENINVSGIYKCLKCCDEKLGFGYPEVRLDSFTTDLRLAFKAMWKAGCTGLGIGARPDFKMFCVTVELDLEKQEVVFHSEPATAICMAIYKLITGKDWKEGA